MDSSESFTSKWGWIGWVDAVSETCHCPWDDVWKMTAVEFLNIVCYARDRQEMHKREIERWKRRH